MSDYVRQGRTNRRNGNLAEAAVARYLRDNGYPMAISSRAAIGAGTRQESDVIGVPGMAIEVKSVRGLSIGAALTQAEQQATVGKVPVVIAKPIGVGYGNVANWFAIMWTADAIGLWPEGGML
jgi:hypothetical protein